MPKWQELPEGIREAWNTVAMELSCSSVARAETALEKAESAASEGDVQLAEVLIKAARTYLDIAHVQAAHD